MPIQDDLDAAKAARRQGRRERGRSDAAHGDGGRGRGAREGHRPLERRRHLRRQGHRLSVLEARPARHATSTTASSSTRPHGPLWATSDRRGQDRPSAVRRRRLRLQRHRRAPVVPAEAAQAGARSPSAIRRAPSARITSPTRWWRCRTPRRASSATHRRRIPTTRSGRSSRCRDARASASRPTTCSTPSSRRRPREVAKRNAELSEADTARIATHDRASPPCATS